MEFPSISTEQLHSPAWQDFLNKLSPKEHYHVSSALLEQAKLVESEEGKSEGDLYRFLGLLMGLRLNVDDNDQPYGSWSVAGPRDSVLDGIDAGSIAALKEYVSNIQNAALRGRVSDILWLLSKRRVEYGDSACKAFTEAASEMMKAGAGWPSYLPLIQRALIVSRSLGKDGQPHTNVCSFVLALIQERAETEEELTSAELIDCLLEQRWGDPSSLAQIAESTAERIEIRNPRFAHRYWKLAAKLWRFETRPDDAKRTELRAAETHVLEAKTASVRAAGGKMATAHFLGQAVVALRRAGASKERVEDVHRQFLDAQSRIHEEMGQISHPIDISEAVQATHKLLTGKNFQESIVLLGAMNRPSKFEELKSQVIEQAKAAPLSFMIGQTIMDRKGRTRARVPSLMDFKSGADAEALSIHTVRYLAQFVWHLRSVSRILPAIDVIASEHSPRIRDFHFLVENNPFVPLGREPFFARGLHAGLHRDFATAGHYLIPEIENSLRSIAEANGGIPLNLSNELIQTDYGVNKLLSMPEVLGSLGEDLTFELKALLCAQAGGNLRHQFAHGMMDEADFYDYDVICLWGMVLHLCAYPFIYQMVNKDEKGEAGDSPGA